MASHICPFCQQSFAISRETHQNISLTFDNIMNFQFGNSYIDQRDLILNNSFFKCPNCEKVSIEAVLFYNKRPLRSTNIYPVSNALQFPDYVPKAIRDDYEEACAIVNLSPKASATLSRRCLQSMINDFWDIRENTLYKSINALEDKVPATQWKVIDGIRRIGNIGAHMEKDINLIIDIEPDEAAKLIKMIELLLRQWYIERHEQEKLYNDIITIDEIKQQDRKGSE